MTNNDSTIVIKQVILVSDRLTESIRGIKQSTTVQGTLTMIDLPPHCIVTQQRKLPIIETLYEM